MADEDGFLDRWSRRKLAARQGAAEAEPEAAETPAGQAAAEAIPDAAEADAEPHPAESIDIGALTRESDFTVFMGAGVPADVRRKALRKLWTTDPVFSTSDGLDDFFDVADTKTWGLGPVRKSVWQIGRGFQSEDDIAPPPRRHDAPDESPVEEPTVEEDLVASAEADDEGSDDAAPEDDAATHPGDEDDTQKT